MEEKTREYLYKWHSRFEKKNLLNWIPDKQYLKLVYYLRVGKKLNLKDPKDYNEKVQWLKLYDRKTEYTKMVDKFEAKKYVAGILGEKYIIPNIGVWNKFEDIDFDSLPNQFVLKCTHDSGGLVIVRNKTEFDYDAARKKINECLRKNYYWHAREWPYKNVIPRIIAEQYLENDPDEGLHDYKVWCFNGKARYIQYISGRLDKTYEGFYDLDWNLQPFTYRNPKVLRPMEKPKQMEELIELADKLAERHAFIRNDFYILPDNTIKFGEMTFYTVSGLQKWTPEWADRKLGDMIDLRNI